MIQHNPKNERVKRRYLIELKERMGRSEATVDQVAKAIASFEAYNKYRDFKTFHYEQAIHFKKHLAAQDSKITGEKLSKATMHATLSNLKRFFQWLAGEPGYKSRLRYLDADYFNMSEKDSRVANAHREKPVPTMEQIKHVLAKMPSRSDIEQRDRALIAFALVTGSRDGAIVSMKLKHVDVVVGSVSQDAREVHTKSSKTFTTYFFPVGDEVRQIVVDWVRFLREVKLWSYDDPLFPATEVVLDRNNHWKVEGLKRAHWSTATPIRKIFREAFTNAGLPYFNPHTFRNTLVHLGETRCQKIEHFKAWSQNLGHEEVLTTLLSYGKVSNRRQQEIIEDLGSPHSFSGTNAEKYMEAALMELRKSRVMV